MRKLLHIIKIKVGNYSLKKISKPQIEHSFINWDNITRIKLLFTRTSDFFADELSSFARELVKQGKIVDVLIHIDRKKLDDSYKNRKNVEYYCRKDLTWLGKPKLETVENFIITKSDLLIVPVFEEILHIKWISVMCNTKMIVAPFSEKNQWANILIKLGDNSIEQFLEQTVHYLKMINKNR